MPLRGAKPQERKPRLKAMLFSPAGVGKTTAAIQMPKPYVIDTESGSTHYGKIIEAKGGAVFSTNDIDEVIKEVKALATEKHDFKTLVIDPFTPLYETKLDEGAAKIGTEHGRHYGYAATACKRMFNLLTILDMNLIVTCHAKTEYGEGFTKLGVTFDGWKKLDYIFDLVFEIQRRGTKRVAIVKKTRLEAFPDQDNFEWSYDALADRYGREKLEAGVDLISFATPEQVGEIKRLIDTVRMPDDWLDKCLSKAGVEAVEDLTSDQISKMIDSLSSRLGSSAHAKPSPKSNGGAKAKSEHEPHAVGRSF